MAILAPISVGELIDKITILRIKATRIGDPEKGSKVRFELDQLEAILAKHVAPSAEMERLTAALTAVNAELWDIEDGKRDCERRQDFGAAFLTLARAVYQKNDHRAAIKRKINLTTGSEVVEVKSYTPYSAEVG